MCGSMADIQSLTAEIRRGNKKRRKKKQDENIMVCPIPQGDHNYTTESTVSTLDKDERRMITWTCGFTLKEMKKRAQLSEVVRYEPVTWVN